MAKPKFKLVRLFHPFAYPCNVYNKRLLIGRDKGTKKGGTKKPYSTEEVLNLTSAQNAVSSKHCEIFLDKEGNWKIKDLQSRNGTFLNRKKIIQQRELRHNDIIGLGVTGSKNDIKSRSSDYFVLQFITTDDNDEDEESEKNVSVAADHSDSDASTCSTESLRSFHSSHSSPIRRSSNLLRGKLKNSAGSSKPQYPDSSSKDDSSDGLSDDSLAESLRLNPPKITKKRPRRASTQNACVYRSSPIPCEREITIEIETKKCSVILHNVFQVDGDTHNHVVLAPEFNKKPKLKVNPSQKSNTQKKLNATVTENDSDESHLSLSSEYSKPLHEISEDNNSDICDSDEDRCSTKDRERPRKSRDGAKQFILDESQAFGGSSPDEMEDYDIDDDHEIKSEIEVVEVEMDFQNEIIPEVITINDCSDNETDAITKNGKTTPSDSEDIRDSNRNGTNEKRSNRSPSVNKAYSKKQTSKRSRPFLTKPTQELVEKKSDSRKSSSSKESKHKKSDSRKSSSSKESKDKESDSRKNSSSKKSKDEGSDSRKSSSKRSHRSSKKSSSSKERKAKKSHSSSKEPHSKEAESKNSHSSNKKSHSKEVESRKSHSSSKKSSSNEPMAGNSTSFINGSTSNVSKRSHNGSLKEADAENGIISRSPSVEAIASLINGCSVNNSTYRNSHSSRNRNLSGDSVTEITDSDHNVRKRKRSRSLDSEVTTFNSYANTQKKTAATDKMNNNSLKKSSKTKDDSRSSKNLENGQNASKNSVTESRNHDHCKKEAPIFNEDTIYQDICCWNVDSLKERNPRYREDVKHRKHLDYITVKKLFKNYIKYQENFYPLIEHEIWTGIQNDLTQNENLDNFQMDVTLENFKVHEINPLTYYTNSKPSATKQWVDIQCSAFASSRQHFQPYRNLCTFKYYVNTKNKQQSVIVRERNTFAFILSKSENFEIVPGSDALTKYSFNLIFHRRDSQNHLDIALDRQGTVQRLSHISLMLTRYDNFIRLKRHPLLDNILKLPKIENIWKYSLTAPYESLVKSCGGKYFNLKQRSIIDYTTSRIMTNEKQPDIMLIQGAPGSGKTKTIAGIAMQLVTAPKFEFPQILICTPSSITLDQVIFYIDEMLQYIDEAARPQIVRVKEPNEVISALASSYVPTSKLNAKLFKNAKIVCCTLNGCSSTLKYHFQRTKEKEGSKPKFVCCIIDEANSASEIESLAPLTFDFRKLLLVGDPNLMEAQVVSPKCKGKQFGRSLFSRLYDHYQKQEPSSPVIRLEGQYRIHEEILKWSNEFFYGGKLVKTPIRVREAKFSSSLEEKLIPYLFCNYLTPDSSGNGFISPEDEIHLVIEILKTIWTETLEDDNFSIGVIILHESKKALLQTKIRWKLPKIYNRVEVDVLEMFQGREKDVIVFPCFPSKEIELISGPTLNTALTRAIQSLTIIGNVDYLKKMDIWKSLVEDAESRKLVQNIAADKIKEKNYISYRLHSMFKNRRNSEIPDESRPPNRLPQV